MPGAGMLFGYAGLSDTVSGGHRLLPPRFATPRLRRRYTGFRSGDVPARCAARARRRSAPHRSPSRWQPRTSSISVSMRARYCSSGMNRSGREKCRRPAKLDLPAPAGRVRCRQRANELHDRLQVAISATTVRAPPWPRSLRPLDRRRRSCHPARVQHFVMLQHPLSAELTYPFPTPPAPGRCARGGARHPLGSAGAAVPARSRQCLSGRGRQRLGGARYRHRQCGDARRMGWAARRAAARATAHPHPGHSLPSRSYRSRRLAVRAIRASAADEPDRVSRQPRHSSRSRRAQFRAVSELLSFARPRCRNHASACSPAVIAICA